MHIIIHSPWYINIYVYSFLFRVCVQAIGATSVGIAVKSVAIARQYLYDDRYVPLFVCL